MQPVLLRPRSSFITEQQFRIHFSMDFDGSSAKLVGNNNKSRDVLI